MILRQLHAIGSFLHAANVVLCAWEICGLLPKLRERKTLQRLLKAALLTLLLLIGPLELLAQQREALQPSSWGFAFSQDLQEPQKTPTDAHQTAEAAHEPHSGCWTSPESDKHVHVVEQSVTAGRLIHKVQPKYPKAARKAHIEGTVVLCAEIRKDGKVASLRALSGPKELIDPSIKAVQQWVYKPYLLDGEPVDVETDIRVNFRLNSNERGTAIVPVTSR